MTCVSCLFGFLFLCQPTPKTYRQMKLLTFDLIQASRSIFTKSTCILGIAGVIGWILLFVKCSEKAFHLKGREAL